MKFVTYAQNFEDVLLWRALGEVANGFYIDVGANDPVEHSVTKAFYDRGWRGINLEPLPNFHAAFTTQRPRDINLAIAAGASAGEVTLYDVPAVNGWATVDAQVAHAHEADGFALATVQVPMRTLTSVCEEHASGDIHFLKIDVEGFEAEVLKGMDFARWRPWVLVVEATLPNSREVNFDVWEPLLTRHGYTFAYFDGLNRYYVAPEHIDLMAKLNVQANVFDAFLSCHLVWAWEKSEATDEALLVSQTQAVDLGRQVVLATDRAEVAEQQNRTYEALIEQRAQEHARLIELRAQEYARLIELRAREYEEALLALQGEHAEQLAALSAQHEIALTDQADEHERIFSAQTADMHRLGAWASDLERRILEMQKSASWRLTAPLRTLGVWYGKVAIPPAKHLEHLLLWLMGRKILRKLLVPYIERFPALERRMGRWAASRQTPAAVPAAVPQAQQFDESAALQAYPMSTRKVYRDLARVCGSLERPSAARPGAARATKRPRLAYLSPLPPQKTGIADYSAELVPELAKYYDIALVSNQTETSDPWIRANLTVHDVAWFEAHGEEFDRVIYHMGNNPVHREMFGLMERFPGVVVMHDFFLGNVIAVLDDTGFTPGAFLRALYGSHGWRALIDHRSQGTIASLWKYPCNKAVLDGADGVIVHSAFSRELADHWYGSGYAQAWHTVPLLRGDAFRIDRSEARDRLGLGAADFLVCSFGMLGVAKLNEKTLQAWLESPLAEDEHCKLVFVGDNDSGPYGRGLLQAIDESSARARIAITGFVDQALYQTYLAACDVAVQLRSRTRGESSASVLDCLLHGVPTIANRHGANAELPDSVLVKIDDVFTQADLVGALVELRRDASLREKLGNAARQHVATCHTPAQVGLLYRDAIEQCVQVSDKRIYKRSLEALSVGGAPGVASVQEMLATAHAIAANQPRPAPRQLLVDVSAVVQTDMKTGIQRVVRSILTALLESPPAGFRVEPVYSNGHGDPYRYAGRYMREAFGLEWAPAEDAPIEAGAQDQFLGLDLFMGGTRLNRQRLQGFRDRGMQVFFVVYDVLPLLRPDCFPESSEADFRGWLETIAEVSHGLVCISRAVADELKTWLVANPPERASPLKIGYFHLGADIGASVPTFGLPKDAEQQLEQIRQRPSFLTVGTVEPRKGHAQALAAFERLWAQGVEVNYVIVGMHGWLVDALALRIKNHPELGKRLFWLQGVSDEMLLKLYSACAGLLASSEGEGFGLPLIEAAQHHLPVVARNLPVFREVMDAHAFYFDGLGADNLADSLMEWLQLYRAGAAPASGGLQWLTWGQSAQQLLDTIERAMWCHEVPGRVNSG